MTIPTFFFMAVPWPEKSAAPKIKILGNVYSYLLVVVLQRVVIYTSIESIQTRIQNLLCVLYCVKHVKQLGVTLQFIHCSRLSETTHVTHISMKSFLFIKNIIIILIKTAQTHMCMVILHELQNKLALMILSHNCFIYFKCYLYVIHFQLIINLLPNFYFKNFDLRKGACKIIKTFVFYYCTILTKNFIFKRKY